MTIDISSLLGPIQTSVGLEKAWSTACQKLRSYAKVNAVAYVRFATDRNGTAIRENPTIVADGFDPSWESIYVSERMHEIDPVHDFAMTVQRPFYWEELASSEKLSVIGQNYFAAGRKAGLSGGLTIPVFGPHLSVGYVSLSFEKAGITLDADEMAVARAVAQALHIRFGEIELSSTPISLSKREREVLVWVARGKSNADIATILELSIHTVDTLLRRVYQKLHAHDRVTAVVKGLSAGIVHKS